VEGACNLNNLTNKYMKDTKKTIDREKVANTTDPRLSNYDLDEVNLKHLNSGIEKAIESMKREEISKANSDDKPQTLGEYYAYGEALMVKAEALVKERITGHRKGLPDEPNYLHSFRVRDRVLGGHHWDDGDYALFVAAMLHDIVEDGGVSLDELKDMGFVDRTIELVDLCTHPMDVKDRTQRWVLMLARLIKAGDEDAWTIKLADLADNLAQSRGLEPENREFMIRVKAPLLMKLSGRINWVGDELKRALADDRNENVREEKTSGKKLIALISVKGKTDEQLVDELNQAVRKYREASALTALQQNPCVPAQCHLWAKENPTGEDLNFAFDVVKTYSDDSHDSRRLIKCKQCGQLYVREFYETIDWKDGEDPQYVTYVPVANETDADMVNKSGLRAFKLRLHIDWPKGEDRKIYWAGR